MVQCVGLALPHGAVGRSEMCHVVFADLLLSGENVFGVTGNLWVLLFV